MAAVCSEYVAVMGDRLISLQNPRDGKHVRDYDTVSNKFLIVRYSDATVVIGYSGRAYLEGIPTDQWLAQQIAEADIDPATISHPVTPRDRPFSASLFRLRSSLRVSPGGNEVTLIVAGFRRRRGRTMPVLLRFDASGTRRGNFLGMRPFRPNEVRVQHIGISPNTDNIRNTMEPFAREDGFDIGVDQQADIFQSIIKDTAAQNPSVGADLMEITMSVTRRPPVVCRFLPADPDRSALLHQVPGSGQDISARPDMMTPWMLSLQTVYPPTVFVGAGPATYRLTWVEVAVVAVGGSPQNNMSISPMKRKPPR